MMIADVDKAGHQVCCHREYLQCSRCFRQNHPILIMSSMPFSIFHTKGRLRTSDVMMIHVTRGPSPVRRGDKVFLGAVRRAGRSCHLRCATRHGHTALSSAVEEPYQSNQPPAAGHVRFSGSAAIRLTRTERRVARSSSSLPSVRRDRQVGFARGASRATGSCGRRSRSDLPLITFMIPWICLPGESGNPTITRSRRFRQIHRVHRTGT